MKRLLVWLIFGLIIVGAAGYAALTYAPGTVVALTKWQAARAAGLSEKTVMVDGYETHYLEGGTGPALVMLHGLADDRHSFVATAETLTDDYTVILPDMKGHGNNARNTARDHSIAGQRALLGRFLDALGHEKVLLAGNSMGGHVAAAFSLESPHRVARLVLVNAPGLPEEDTVVYRGFDAPLDTVAAFDARVARVVHEPRMTPKPIKRHMMQQINARMDFMDTVAGQIRAGGDHDLSRRIAALEVPTLVLWGEEDVLVPFAVAEAYVDSIPDGRLITLSGAGHSPQLEAPRRVAKAIAGFLDGAF